ncbi:MAG: hypothetical protein IPN76_07500 [Saprospiraceae bacterium]|nr:hypothetical protein [Saprospiraceae bacterium]
MKKQIALSFLVSLIQFSYPFSQAAPWGSLEFEAFAQFKMPENVELIDSSNSIVYLSRDYFQTLQASKARIPNLKVADEFSLNKYYEISIELFNKINSLDTFKVEKIIVNRLSGRILTGRKSDEGGADQIFKAMMFLSKTICTHSAASILMMRMNNQKVNAFSVIFD